MSRGRADRRAKDSAKAKRSSSGKGGVASQVRASRYLVVASIVLGCGAVPVAMSVWSRNAFGPAKAVTLSLAALLGLLGLSLDRERARALWDVLTRSKLAWAIGATLGLAALSTVLSINSRMSLLGSWPDYRGLLAALACTAVGLATASCWLEDGSLRVPGRTLAVAGLVVGAVALYERGTLGVTGWADWEVLRVASTLGNASNLGVFCALALPFVFERTRYDESVPWRIAGAISGLLLVAAAVWSGSRGGWIAVLAAAGVWLVLEILAARSAGRAPQATRSAVVALGALGLTLVLALTLTPNLRSRALSAFDPSARTAQWRIATWSSAVDMVRDRPLLGWGPNSFRYAYPAYQTAGQIDGHRGYQVVESAHNLLADTGTSLGVPGVVLLLLVGVACGVVVVSRLRDGTVPWQQCAAAAASLGGGFVGLQFHYPTLDTGPSVFAALGLVVAWESWQPAARPARNPRDARGFRIASALGVAIMAVVLVGALLGFAADASIARAWELVERDTPWEEVRPHLETAQTLAGFQPFVHRLSGTVSAVRFVARTDEQALRDGVNDFDNALRLTPDNPVLITERASLLLLAGQRLGDETLTREALSAFESATRMDPNTGIPRAGKADALLVLGRVDEAIESYERALQMSPRYRTAWRHLATVYESVGEADKAARARRKAGD